MQQEDVFIFVSILVIHYARKEFQGSYKQLSPVICLRKKYCYLINRNSAWIVTWLLLLIQNN